MRYTPPPFEVAEKLLQEITELLQSCGGHYISEFGKSNEVDHILISLATGHFNYKKNYWFVSWFMSDDIESLKNKVLPQDVTYGTKMWVTECGIKQGSISDIRRKMRRSGKRGAYWHRAGKGFRDFPRQEGADGKPIVR